MNADDDDYHEIENIQEQMKGGQNNGIKAPLNFNEEDAYEDDLDNKKLAKKRVKFPEETSRFRQDSHGIILNLSKYTLRKIVMLICDEAVSIV